MIAQLPPELSWIKNQTEWAVGHGYLWRFVRSMMWDRAGDGQSHFERALAYKARIDKPFLQYLSAQIISYKEEFGTHATQQILDSLLPYLEKLGSHSDVKWLKGNYSISDAFYRYAKRDYANVPSVVFQALINDPSYLSNRGVLKILLNSLVRR